MHRPCHGDLQHIPIDRLAVVRLGAKRHHHLVKFQTLGQVGCCYDNELKTKSIQFRLDSFGSGASPLALLKELPIDFLKVDRSLVQATEVSPESCVLLEALVTISNTYRIEVMAEGIENESQLSRLRELGCLFAQGCIFRRPIETAQGQPRFLPERTAANGLLI